jgi:hypothetical protein
METPSTVGSGHGLLPGKLNLAKTNVTNRPV